MSTPSEVAANQMSEVRYHHESSGFVRAAADEVFAYLDDHSRLSDHMTRRSWQMAWGKMNVFTDEGGGRGVGSHIRLSGNVLGIRIDVDEVVIERRPYLKRWRTVGIPHLLVIGSYEMGFALQTSRDPAEACLTVGIDYSLPTRGLDLLLGILFGHWYARWCTRRMLNDAQAHFSQPGMQVVHAESHPQART